MKKLITALILISGAACAAIPTNAQPAPGAQREMQGQRRYDIIVNQQNDTLSFNRSLRALRGNSALLSNRGILGDIASGYISLGTSTLLSASQNLLGAGLAFIKEAARDKRPDWEKATLGENRFVKRLPMYTEILDFYSAPSTIGALDPTDMKFSGFGCRQYIVVNGDDGKPREEEVFYLSCSLRDDEQGIARMLNHSKFEVVVDELRFNPYLCNLPNDSLSADPSTRIDFDFDKRSDLEFKVVATVTSSWINEAIQVAKDVELGRFTITAKIDPRFIGEDNTFRYNRKEDIGSGKVVTVTGDSFIVPRSYVGSADMSAPGASWGTGQYKVEMDISESCRINEKYYTAEKGGKRHWLKERWQPEWKLMKKRPKRGGSAGTRLADVIFPSFSGDNWITTIIEPATTVLLSEEGKLVNASAAKLAGKMGITGTKAQGNPAQGAASGSSSGQNRQGQAGQGQNPGQGHPH